MRRSLRRDEIERIRRRHHGYRLLLLTVTLVLLLQPLARHWPQLNPLGAIALALVTLLFISRYSLLRVRMGMFIGLGIAGIAGQVLFLLMGIAMPSALMLHLAVVDLLIWSLFLGAVILRLTRALMREPYVTLAVVMGAAAGYLLIGYAGAFLLHTLLLLQPGDFAIAQLSPGINPSLEPLQSFPAMVTASLGALTTTGGAIGKPGAVLPASATLAITILGQLYVAVLIALILGRFHRRSGV
jgi:hypothetical protein